MAQGYPNLPDYYGQSSNPMTPNLGLSLIGMDPIIAENFVLVDTAVGGGSSTVEVNGAPVANPDFNDLTPAAPGGFVNVLWQVIGSSVSAYVPTGGGGSTITVNGATVDNPNFNDSNPTPPPGSTNVVWQVDGPDVSAWVNNPQAAGSDGDVQFNNGGNFDGDPKLNWDHVDHKLTIGETDYNSTQAVDLAPSTLFVNTGFLGSDDASAGLINSAFFYYQGFNAGNTLGYAAVMGAEGQIFDQDGGTTVDFLGVDVAISTDPSSGSTNVTNMYGVRASLAAGLGEGGSGNVDTMYGFYSAGLVDGSSSVNNYYGVRVTSPTITGFLGNIYGVFIDDMSGVGAAQDAYSLWVVGQALHQSQILMVNNTPATNVQNQNSPDIGFTGEFWDGALTQNDDWTIGPSLGTGANPTSTFSIQHTGSPGAATIALLQNTAVTGTLTVSGKITNYNSIATVSNGVPAEYASVGLTTQAASIGSTTLYAVPASGAGVYRVTYYMKVTRAASTSSSVTLTLGWTDRDDSTALSMVVPTPANATDNTSVVSGTMIVDAKLSTNLTYQTTYASTGGTTMQYKLRIKVEAL